MPVYPGSSSSNSLSGVELLLGPDPTRQETRGPVLRGELPGGEGDDINDVINDDTNDNNDDDNDEGVSLLARATGGPVRWAQAGNMLP